MHTENKARETWCPMARGFDPADNGGATATNRPLSYGDRPTRADVLCIGSRCAVWRWADGEPVPDLIRAEDRQATTEPPRPSWVPKSWNFCPYDPDEGDPAQWIEDPESTAARRRGYCGLAGPQAYFTQD